MRVKSGRITVPVIAAPQGTPPPMYTKHFGLNEKPFSITPDPRYLFLSDRHREGLAHLIYGVKDSSGFIQLTGEVGTGKTTLVRTLLARIPSGVNVAMILNPQLSATEFLETICEEFSIPLPADKGSAKALVDALNQYLLTAHADGRRSVLLVDEAQNLSTEVLEQIRLLTNLETAKLKLLQIILIAQPELREKLAQVNLRQLAQRITGRYHLEPLSSEESSAYIDHRLKVAGGLGNLFDDRAKREVYRFSKGVPRLINVICDRALLGAYSQEVRQISAQIVRKAAAEVSGESISSRYPGWLYPAIGLATVAIIGAGLWTMTSEPQSRSATVTIPTSDVPQEPAVTITATAAAPVEQISLDTVLRNSAAFTTHETAMKNLLSIWNVDYDSSKSGACAAEDAGLSCVDQRGSWSVLQQLDRPAVLTLTDSEGRSHEAVVVAINDDSSADLLLGDQRMTFPVDAITRLWYGQYLMVWRPATSDPASIRPGTRGPAVLWLRQSLAKLDPEFSATGDLADVFDAELGQHLIEFQRRNRLKTDGFAGQQTQIIINSRLRLGDRPGLSRPRASQD